MRCVQEGETQDSTGNTGSTGLEHGNMHRLGKGQGTRDYYTMNNRKKGRDLATTKFGCRTRFRDSQRSCGHDNCGCRDSELAVVCQQCHMGVTGRNSNGSRPMSYWPTQGDCWHDGGHVSGSGMPQIVSRCLVPCTGRSPCASI